ncbi:MAG TPA: YciI family protein [Streptosporangiaceae bacterium]
MRYMMIHYMPDSVNWDDNGEEIDDPEGMRALTAWDEEMKARGILVGGGFLRPSRETVTLRLRDGEKLITDGPFAETKEQIAGYGILECADLDQAIEVSMRHPSATFGTFELRAYAD